MPVRKLLEILLGSVVFRVEREDKERCLNGLHRGMIAVGGFRVDDGGFYFEARRRNEKKIKAVLDKSGIKVYSIRGKGLPFLVKRYRHRAGIAAGAALFCFMLWVSKLYVWQIEFSGNENISDIQVEQQLLEAGFGVGSYIPDVDLYRLCNIFLQQTEDFSYISVNMEGTTAKVELRERSIKNKEDGYRASNLVAKYSGQIDSMTVYSGKAVVEREAVVKEGELLVSGFLEKTFGFDIVRARGSVYAYVTRSFEEEVPFLKEARVYTGESQKKYEITFFGRNITLYSDFDGGYEAYDETNDRERVVLFDRIKLPFVLTKTVRREYRTEAVMLTPEEAKAAAEVQLSRTLTTELEGAEILERKVTEEVTDNSYKLICEIYCIEDIAMEKEILIDQTIYKKD